MTIMFDIDKITKYLEKYKNDLSTLYKWNAKIDKLVELDTLTAMQVEKINKLEPFEKELQLKKKVGEKLNDARHTDKELFDKLCLWVIKDWGGITTTEDNNTLSLIDNFLIQDKPNFNRIASSSKVGAFMFPDKNVIYDSRVAYSINWIILSENAGKKYFPIPEGRNSKMAAFDMNVLIRLKNISVYQPKDITQLNDRLYISNSDKKLFINKNDAYFELNKLVKEINQRLWKGNEEREQNLYYTEMLLFSIADSKVFMEIMTKYGLKSCSGIVENPH